MDLTYKLGCQILHFLTDFKVSYQFSSKFNVVSFLFIGKNNYNTVFNVIKCKYNRSQKNFEQYYRQKVDYKEINYKQFICIKIIFDKFRKI